MWCWEKAQALALGDPGFVVIISVRGQNFSLSWLLFCDPSDGIKNHPIMYFPGLP